MLVIFVTLSLVHSISASSTVECPDNSPNWFVSGDSCYLVSLEPLSWFASQEVILFIFFIIILLDIALVLLGNGRISSWADHHGGGHSVRELSRAGNILLDWTERCWEWGNLEVDGKSQECKLHQLVAESTYGQYWQQLCFQILTALISGLGWLPLFTYRVEWWSNTRTVWSLTFENSGNKFHNIWHLIYQKVVISLE